MEYTPMDAYVEYRELFNELTGKQRFELIYNLVRKDEISLEQFIHISNLSTIVAFCGRQDD